MPTGSLIRDFTKAYREARYSNSGSFALSEIEHNAYLNRLTIEVDAVDAQRYYNSKTLPSHSHYGYLTTFKGSSVLAKIPVEFARQRVFEGINQGIWNYHQSTESLQLSSSVSVSSSNKSSNNLLEKLGEGVTDVLCFAVLLYDETPVDGGMGWITDILGCDEEEVEGNSISEKYRGFPIASPFPDIFKFKGDIPLSFRFRLESWYLVPPLVYVVDNPTDTDDETEDEDEYPQPDEGDGDGDGSEFPSPDPVPSDRDPRDFGGGGLPTGGQSQIRIRWKAYSNPQANRNTVEQAVIVHIVNGLGDASLVTTGCDRSLYTAAAGTFCVEPTLNYAGTPLYVPPVSVPDDWIIQVEVVYFP